MSSIMYKININGGTCNQMVIAHFIAGYNNKSGARDSVTD